MNQSQSLDEIISQQAVVFADQIKQAAAFASKEEEIRIEAEKALAFIQREAGIKLEGRHEFTIGTGRADSVYDCVIIEYKNPASPDKLSAKSDAAGNKKVVEQLKKRFYDMRTEFGRPLNTMLGVGCDGNYFIFVRFRDDKWDVQTPVEVNRYSAERFLWALFNLGTKGKAFAPEYLAGDFGSDALLAQDGIRSLYETISTTTNPKAQTFFHQWQLLFAEVCGYDVNSPSDKIKKLGDFYGVYGTTKPAELLFAVHTYYALFMKLLASEIVAFFHKLPTPLQRIIQAGTSNKLRREMEELEAGSIFRHLNITNFLEGDLFAWYPEAWCESVEKLIRDMVAKLDGYNPGTLSEDPAGSRDLLKKLYQQLFPKSVRHDLGEYYTPDWLAEHVLNELDYTGDPDKRLLDPACGSGTFLVMVINRIRKWYDDNRERCPYNEGDLCRKILQNIIGFDLNPLAVMAARTNYLIAIRDLISHVDRVEIPVYLCDSIMTPAEYGGLTAGRLGDVQELKTSAARFLIPTEIATKRDDVAKYAEQLEFCVRNGYSPEEFIERCGDESIPVTAESLHIDLYNELVKLDKENKNGIWARIIKNSFAPLFIDQVDYVAGNPPWINWRNLPAEYRESIAPLWQVYNLFTQTGLNARLGAGMDDISVLMLFVAADKYLVERGRLGFVITQTLFKSAGGGKGFRRLQLNNNRYLNVVRVCDFSTCQPFEGATNRTAVLTIRMSETPNVFPVKYRIFTPNRTGTAAADLSISEINSFFSITDLEAFPIGVEADSSWITLKTGLHRVLRNIQGSSPYRGRIGAHTGGAAGVFWVEVINRVGKKLLIRNLWDAGRNKFPEVTKAVENDFVRPVLRGKDVDRWKAISRHFIFIPYDLQNSGKAVTESRLRTHYPRTFEYFNTFKDRLINRPHYRQHFASSGQPYWSMYNVGDYSFAKHRVVWREQSATFKCCVVPVLHDNVMIADAKLIVVECSSSDEAHFLAACLNSSPARFLIQSYAIEVQISTHVLSHVAVPAFNGTALHQELAEKSRRCHAAAAKDDTETVTALESEIDKAAAQLWELTDDELKTIQDALKDMEKLKRGRRRK